MHRRGFVLGAAMAAGTVGRAGAAELDLAAARRSPTYSESVALVLFSPDGGEEVSLRLQRMPGMDDAILWAGVETADLAYGVAQTIALPARARATAVERERAVFRARGAWEARFERAPGLGRVRLSAKAHASAEPPTDEGSIPMAIEARYATWHPPVLVRPGRMEGFGEAEAVVRLPDRTLRIKGYAKWHEQTGERPRFAPAFTYMALSGPGVGLLAVRGGGGAYGFALRNGRTTAVKGFEISPLGPSRTFWAELVDGQVVEGTTVALRTTSVPIEGTRRPSASVTAQTGLGVMVGHVNDWNPPAEG